jgi:hypothetical protein
MADDINIVISVEDRDVIRARKHQNKLQAAVAQLEKEFRKQNITGGKMRSELNKQASALSRLGGSYKKALSEVNTYSSALSKATDAQVHQAQSMAMAKRGMNKFGMVSQQVGYQVGDFFVQVQSGTSALVAFGQQGTQLAGLIPGIGGAIIGIGLAIGTMVLRTRQQMKEAEDGIMSYAKAIKKVKEVITELGIELKLLKSQYTTEEELALSIKLKQNEAEIDNLVTQKAANSFRLTGLQLGTRLYSDMLSAVKSLNGELDKEIDNINKINDGHKKELKSIVDLRVEIQKIKDERKLAAKEYDDQIIRGLAKVEAENKKHYRNLLDIVEKGEAILLRSYKEYGELRLKSEEHISNVSRVITMRSYKELAESRLKSEEDISNRLRIKMERSFRELAESRLKSEEDLTERLSKKYEDRILRQQGITQGEFKADLEKANLLKETTKQFKLQNKEAQRRIKLLEVELDYGEDSLELEKAILQQERWRKIEAAREAKLSEGMIHVLDMRWTREMNLLLLARKQREEKEKLLELEQERADFEKKIEGFLESGFMSMIDGTKSVTDAFRSMATDVIKELYRILVVQQIVNQAKTAITSLSGYVFPNANGNAFNNGKIIPYANGGVVGSPTMFPMSGGNTGLMGEAGPEAILPLKRGPNGKLGVESSGGSVVVNQTINVSTGVAQTVRNEIKTLMPQIAEGAKSAVLDAKRRGGSFGSAFA